MKTKKDILKWWENLGPLPIHNDLDDFLEKLDRNKIIIMESNDLYKSCFDNIVLKMFAKTWKYPLYLYFYKKSCYRIIGF